MQSAGGDLKRLADLLLARETIGGLLLVPGARESAGDLPALLQGRIAAKALAVYESFETGAAAPDGFDAVLIHSARAGRALTVLGPFDRQTAVALSAAAGEPLGDRSGLAIRIAATPDEPALIAALGKPAPRV